MDFLLDKSVPNLSEIVYLDFLCILNLNFFGHQGNYFMDFLSHILNLVKTNDHVEFLLVWPGRWYRFTSFPFFLCTTPASVL